MLPRRARAQVPGGGWLAPGSGLGHNESPVAVARPRLRSRAVGLEPMLLIPPHQRRCLGASLLLGGLLVGLPRAWAALETAPTRADRAPLGGPQVRVLLGEAPILTVRAPAGARMRLRDGSGQVLMELGPDQPLRLQLAGSQVLGLAEAGAGPAAPAYDPATGPPLVPRLGPSALATAPATNPNADLAEAGQGATARTAPSVAQRLRTGELVVEPVPAPGSEGSVWLQKHHYRGRLWIRPQGDVLQVVNLVGLETYLASVVGSEMPASWPLEALRAQAVAARTYALRALRPSSGRAYDLKATVASQVYLGVEAETASTQAAVAGTRGLVLTYGDGLIEAVFHSSAGGSTENSGELWAQQLPYLVSVADFDRESPVRDWRLPLSDDLVRKAFPEIGSLERIEVLSTSSSGRVRQARVVGSAGVALVSGAELRSRLGLKSTLVQFVREPVNDPTLGAPAGAAAGQLGVASPGPGLTRWSLASPSPGTGSPALGASTASATSPLAASAQAASPSVAFPWPTVAASSPAGKGETAVASGDGPGFTPGSAPALLLPPPPASGDSPAAYGRLQWVAIGHGFGHGIGMSQWGALAMARRGDGFEQILQHYYRGTQLRPYTSLAALAPLLQPRLGLGPIPPRPLALTLGATP